ncbi:MAG: DUF2975 domain-containing protein [Actinomycetaceae bacterium]|nr:DUF2975 domain-containing protein [Actinomycetaceae bacterium]MDU0970323.1 DUF2975 domain-containing protein [Actinomycetaceae bacterium]
MNTYYRIATLTCLAFIGAACLFFQIVIGPGAAFTLIHDYDVPAGWARFWQVLGTVCIVCVEVVLIWLAQLVNRVANDTIFQPSSLVIVGRIHVATLAATVIAVVWMLTYLAAAPQIFLQIVACIAGFTLATVTVSLIVGILNKLLAQANAAIDELKGVI